MFTLRELMFIYSCCVNIFISLFSFLCCNCQQAMEDLMEDEDEDFDKDDKVIMSCVRDALTHKHIHKRMHTHTHTLPQEVLTPLHTPETQTDERNDSIFPSHLHPCSVILSAWGTNTCTKIVQPFNLLKSFLCRYAHGTFLVFLPSSSASPWSFSAVCYTLLISPFIQTQYRIYVTNAVLQSCFLRTCTHIKCLVSYLGPFTAPLCSSKTASGLVQTLSGNNRWLLYCLRSFALLKTATETNATGKDTVPCQCPTWER